MNHGGWAYSIVHEQLCQFFESELIWDETICRVWPPSIESVVRSSLRSQAFGDRRPRFTL